MKPVLISSSRHKSAGERVNDNNFSVLDHIINITLLDAICVDRLIDTVRYTCIFRIIQIVDAKEFFYLFCPARSKDRT